MQARKRGSGGPSVFETLTQGVFRQLADGTLVDVNEAALTLLGLTRGEFLSRTSTALGLDVLRENGTPLPAAEHPSRAALGTGEPVRGAVCGVRNERTGERLWVEVNAVPEFLPAAGRPYRVTVTIHDISAHRRTEEALRFKDRLIERASSAIATCDLDGKMTFGNPSFLKMWGFAEPAEFLGRPFSRYWQVEERMPEIMESLLGRGTWFGEVKAVRKSGEVFDVQVSAASILDGRGEPVGLTSTSTEITERKKAEESLRESRQRLLLAVRTARLAVWDWDIGQNAVRLSRGLGAPFEDAPAEGTDYEWWAERIHPEDRDAVMGAFEKALAGRRTSLVLKYRFRRPDGTFADLHDRCLIIRDASKKVSRVLGVVQDVTALVRAEEELRRSRDELAARVLERTAELDAANRELRNEMAKRELAESQLRHAQKMEALGTLTGGIAHDINNILTPIVVNSELAILDLPEDSGVRSYLDLILKSGLRGKGLVRQMLLFSRKSERQRQVLKLSSLLQESFRLLRSSIPSTIDMRFTSATEDDLVNADPSQIQQVIVNLCVNAAYAMKDGSGAIEISLGRAGLGPADLPEPDMRPGDYLVIDVKDTGPGMPPEIMGRIFEPFFTTKPAGEGTGLGLSVVYGIVKAHAGGITVSSQTGRGSDFRVYLPVARAEFLRPSESPGPLPRGSERILVVDDEEIIASSVRDMLERLGYRAVAVTGGPAALKLFSEKPGEFDLVIMDQTMPGLTGKDAGRELLRLSPGLPIILCTGYSDLISAGEIEKLGFRGFLMKPFSLREGARLVRQVLDGSLPG